MAKIAHVGYSSTRKAIEVAVPHGTKSAELSHVLSAALAKGIVGKLRRPCTTCFSGDHLLIREQLEEVINVDLEKKT